MRRPWLLLIGAAVALAGAIGVGWSTARSSERVWWLPDNTMLALDGITYGRTHQITHGNWWQKALLLILPPGARQQFETHFGCRTLYYTSARPNTLVLWIYRRGPRPGVGVTGFRKIRSVLFDEQGNEFETGGRGRSFIVPRTSAEILNAVEVPVFPRRGQTIGVRIYQQAKGGGWERLASCTVPNPAPGPYPAWIPQPLPVTRTGDGLAVTMTELTAAVPNRELPRVARGREAAWTRASFRVAGADGSPVDWEPVGVTISDATGNVWTPRASFADRRGKTARLYFVGAPWPGERAWQWRVEFARTAGFTPAERWTVAGIPVPGLGEPISAGQPTTKDGVTIDRVSLFVPPKSVPEAGWRKGIPRLMLLTSRPLSGQRLTLVRATDPHGRGVPASEIIQTHTDREFEAELRVPPRTQSVNLTFALHRTRPITFVTAPPGSWSAGQTRQ